MQSTRTKKVSVQTTGCRLNQYESEKMAADLSRFGFTRAEKGEKADLYIINTCTVTHRADQSSRYLIRRAARENPGASIVVAGCYVDNDPELIAGMEGVDVIIRNTEKDFITDILPRHLPDLFEDEPDKNCSTTISDFSAHNRAWLKISDGCNQWCSFCILPTVRGKLRHREANIIIDEINQLVDNGYEEVVLTGLNMGYYQRRKDTPPVKNLAALCEMILDQTDIRRIRLSSIEPQTVRGDLLDLYRNSDGRICRHWHLSLQSGSSRILEIMRRPYDRDTYIKRVSDVKSAQPNTIIGADVIVGFPGETDHDFNETKSLAESGLIDYLHVFSYSDRRNTVAASIPDKINPEVIKERNAILTRISHDLRAKAHARQVGQTLDVIAQFKKSDGRFHWGIADNYIKVKLPDSYEGGKRIVDVHITASHSDHVTGKIIN